MPKCTGCPLATRLKSVKVKRAPDSKTLTGPPAQKLDDRGPASRTLQREICCTGNVIGSEQCCRPAPRPRTLPRPKLPATFDSCGSRSPNGVPSYIRPAPPPSNSPTNRTAKTSCASTIKAPSLWQMLTDPPVEANISTWLITISTSK
jgi:hypothetical protein